MTEQTDTPSPAPRLCPICGTRVGDAATKCIVCGTDLESAAAEHQSPEKKKRSLGVRGLFKRRDKTPSPPPSGAAELPGAELPQPQAAPPPVKPAASKPPPAAGTAPKTGPLPGTGALSPLPNEPDEPAPPGRITVPLPIVLIVLVVFILFGVVLVLNAMGIPIFSQPTPTITATMTQPPTFTPPPTNTPTSTATPTPLPPIEHLVAEGDTCLGIAAQYGVTPQSILSLNGFPQNCPLSIGQLVLVPAPTPTPEPTPTSTLAPEIQTQQAWPRHIVGAGESLSSIAALYQVDFNRLAEVNGKLPPDYAVLIGEELLIPDAPLPTAGPTPTHTPLPPYPAPRLFIPFDGAAVSSIEQTVTLQWESGVELRENEAWLVTVEDVTANTARRIEDTTTTNRYVVTVEMKPFEAVPHVFRWTVVAVRQVATTEDGAPVYEPAGATSEARTFTWVGIGIIPTDTPAPSP